MRCELPFIHLFKTPRCFYFYDVNKDTIVPISDTMYQYLNGIMNNLYTDGDELTRYKENTILDDKDKAHIEFLLSRGYLSKKRIRIFNHPDTENLEYYQNHRCEQVILQVTQACNLMCDYCPFASKTVGDIMRNHSSKQMSIEIAKKSIDFYAEHSDEAKVAKVGFYGGEPLIAFDLIRKVVEYAKTVIKDKNIIFTMTTNGTLINDEIINFLVENKFIVLFSIDGPQRIHDKKRVKADGTGSFESAYGNYLKVLKAYGKEASSCIAFNMVLDPEEDFQETVDFLKKDEIMGSGILVMSDIPEDVLLEEKIHLSEQFLSKKRYYEFLQYVKYLNIVPGMEESVPIYNDEIQRLAKLYERFKGKSTELPDEGAPGGPCIPGGKKLFVNVDGDLFPCEKVNEKSPAVKIGTIFEGFDIDSSKRVLNIGALSAEKCRGCYAIVHCRMCAKYADDGMCLTASCKVQRCGESITMFENDLIACALIKESKTIYKHRRRQDAFSNGLSY